MSIPAGIGWLSAPIVGASSSFQVSPTATKRAQVELVVLVAGADQRRRVVVDRDVLGRAFGAGRNRGRTRAVEIGEFALGREEFLFAGELGESAGGGLQGRFEPLFLLRAEAGVGQFARRDQQQLESRAILVLEREDQLFGHFRRRDHFPGVDAAVFVLVEAPARAAGLEPAILVGLAVEIGVDVAIDSRPSL